MSLHLEIAGTGSYLPRQIISSKDFAGRPLNVYDTSGNVRDSKVLTEDNMLVLGGIRTRRRAADGEVSSEMGYKAARIALENSGLAADSLVGIIFATVSEDSNFPSGACKIQEKLGVKRCVAYDLAAACAGFPEALAQADARVTKMPGNYLVVAAEHMSCMTDYTDINSWLFGDGAGAAVLTPTESQRGILSCCSYSQPLEGRSKWIYRDSTRYLRMPEGKSVMREAISEMTDCAKSLKRDAGWDKADVYIPHQANARIIQGVRKKVESEGSIVYENIERYGNMSAATCPVALDEALKDGTIVKSSNEKKGSRVILVSFGAGVITAGSAIQF